MRHRLGSCAATTAGCAVAAALCAKHACEVVDARGAVSPSVVAATVALHVATLVGRSEAWRLTLTSVGGDGELPDLFAAMGVLRLVPVVPERRWGSAGPRVIRIEVRGQGEPLVLIHGLATTSAI